MFFLDGYVSTKNAMKLSWIPMEERRELNSMKFAYKAERTIHLLIIEKNSKPRDARSTRTASSIIAGIFQDQASKQLNRKLSSV